MSVADLLQESLAEHRRANQLRRKGQKADARKMLARAYELRKLAHDADPEHESPAWRDEQRHTPTSRDTHTDLMAFYREQLGDA